MASCFLLVSKKAQETVGRRERTANDDCVGEGAAMVKTDNGCEGRKGVLSAGQRPARARKVAEFRDVPVADKLVKLRCREGNGKEYHIF